MTTPSKLNEFHHAEEPALPLLERLRWTYVPRDRLAVERCGEREVVLKGGFGCITDEFEYCSSRGRLG